MSRVFLALDQALGRRVVVKVLLPELAAGVNVERFRREILLAAQLQHPHIVPLLSAGQAGALPYFIMPFVAGESLRARMSREGELPIAEAVRILRDVVSALAYAHSCGVVHRDVKPDNVLISGGVAVVTAFGVAKAVSISSASGSSATPMTSFGVALGTPTYMAPEQATASPQTDHRADIYALGAMAYEMLTGLPPFAGRSPQAMLAAHVMEEPEPVERRRPVIPPMLAGLVRDCLAKRPADRPQTALEVMHVLDAIATPTGGTVPTRVVPARTLGDGTPLPRPGIAGALVAMALLLGAGGLWLWRQPPGPARSGPPIAEAPAAGPAPSADSPASEPPVRPPPPTTEPDVPAEPPVPRVDPKPTRDRRPVVPRPAETPREAPTVRPPPPEDVSPVPALPQIRAPAESGAAFPPAPTPEAATAPPPVRLPVEETAPASDTTPAAATPAPPPPAPSRPADPKPEIQGLLTQYARAIETRSLSDLKRIYPEMTAPQQRGWEQFFQLVRDVTAQLEVETLDVSGSKAEARVRGTYTYVNTSTQRSERQPVSFHATLQRKSARWSIVDIR
jgi:serine/threonine-protein kinase